MFEIAGNALEKTRVRGPLLRAPHSNLWLGYLISETNLGSEVALFEAGLHC